MLTRLYVDNFRCFENFEYQPARKQLIFGANGTGKSSMVDAVFLLRQISIIGAPLESLNIPAQRTRWMSRTKQTMELEAELGSDRFIFRIVLEPIGDPARTRVVAETLHVNGKPIFSFEGGEVRLFNDRLEHKVTYPFDWHRSAFATIASRKDNQTLTRFKTWLSTVNCFRINPFAISARTDSEQLYPNGSLDNFAGWYRHLVQSDPGQNFALTESLRKAVDGFQLLRLQEAGENVRLLVAEFQSSGRSVSYLLQELSEGQRCLICLYTILHFLLSKGHTVLIDEPDNFISLREIQPWLVTASDAAEDNRAQLLLISHHPEIIDQWAPSNGAWFMREEGGAVRVKKFEVGGPEGVLSASELVARGWAD